MHRLACVLLLVGCAADDMAPPAPTSAATGELGSWQTAAPLPVARANHCSAAIRDWVLVIGGNRKDGTDFVKTADIHAARVAADGTLGPWQLAGQAPSPVTECTATGDATSLYLVDGLYDDDAVARQVWTATLDDTGHLSALTSLGHLPASTIVVSSEATVHGGELVVMDTRLPDEGEATVTLRTPVTPPLAWTTMDWGIGFRAQAQYAFARDTMFVLGGYTGETGNPVTAETFVAPADGGAHETTPLPVPTSFGEAVGVDDWVFVVGGRGQVFGAPGTTKVVAAHHDGGGNLGPWQEVSALPMARTNHEVALVGDYLVLTGGAANGPGDTTVLTARVRFAAP